MQSLGADSAGPLGLPFIFFMQRALPGRGTCGTWASESTWCPEPVFFSLKTPGEGEGNKPWSFLLDKDLDKTRMTPTTDATATPETTSPKRGSRSPLRHCFRSLVYTFPSTGHIWLARGSRDRLSLVFCFSAATSSGGFVLSASPIQTRCLRVSTFSSQAVDIHNSHPGRCRCFVLWSSSS